MTLRAELRENWRSNRWMRRVPACLAAMVLWIVAQCWLSLGFAGFFAAGPIDAAYVVCFVLAARTAATLRTTREAEERRSARVARELRTPRVPDAGPDQCPVCGGYGLTELAADDVFMERGERAKVVPWGRKRAHRDCAEFVPYVAPPHFERVEIEGHRVYCVCSKCERATTNPGARRWCKFCGFYRWAESADAAKAELIAHAKVCPERPNARLLTDKSCREGGGVLNPGRVFMGPGGEAYVDHSPGSRWLWPDLKGRGK